MRPRIGVAAQVGMDDTALIAAARDVDVDFVELMLEGPGERRRLAERSEPLQDALSPSMGLVVHLPFGGVEIGAPLEHVRAGSLRELEACLDVAAALGAEKAVVHADSTVRPEHWDHETVRANVGEALDQLARYGADRSVEVCAENVPGPIVPFEQFPTVIERSGVAATLDTGHARASGLDDTEIVTFVEAHGAAISHVHLNDTRGDGDEHLPVGMGTVDFEAILGAFPDGWAGTLTVEALTGDFGYVALGVDRLRALLA